VTIQGEGRLRRAHGGAASMLSTSRAGACTLTASQAGDRNHNAAVNVVHPAHGPAGDGDAVGHGANKVYDRSNAAEISGRSLNGTFGTDQVSLLGGTATFADKNVGTARP
jgi:hypothetical protein